MSERRSVYRKGERMPACDCARYVYRPAALREMRFKAADGRATVYPALAGVADVVFYHRQDCAA